MATVYRAHDSRLGVDRAVKVLNENLCDQKRIRQRFESEAQTMARLHHPHIVTVTDVGNEDGRPYIVMELMAGGSLSDHLPAGGMAARTAVSVTIGVLRALAHAHKQGVIHRDIKPDNILLTADGTAKLTDFGIARVVDHSVTRTNAVMGTWAFMPPEQRVDAKRVDARSDIFAVGATLYLLATGREPFDLYVVSRHERMYAAVEPALAEVIKTATNYEPEDRYASADAMLAALLEMFPALPEVPAGTPEAGWNLTSDQSAAEISLGTLRPRASLDDSLADSQPGLDGPTLESGESGESGESATFYVDAAPDESAEAAAPVASDVTVFGGAPPVTTTTAARRSPWPVLAAVALIGGVVWFVTRPDTGPSASSPSAVSATPGSAGSASAGSSSVGSSSVGSASAGSASAGSASGESASSGPASDGAAATERAQVASARSASSAGESAASTGSASAGSASASAGSASATAESAEPPSGLGDDAADQTASGTLAVGGGAGVQLRAGGAAYAAGSIPAGSYEVWADFGGGWSQSGSATIAAGATTTVKCSKMVMNCKVSGP